jgi:Ala-tRNA(Pro) deacylase
MEKLSGRLQSYNFSMAPEEKPVFARLRELRIPFERFEHPPIATAEEGVAYWHGIDATHCKNLFLRNQKGSRHYLVILDHRKRADLRVVADRIGDGKLSFASPDRLMKYLGVTPGSVSPFGLVHDTDQHVRVHPDRDLRSTARISFHPNINTATLVVAFVDFERFLASTGNIVRYIDVSRAAAIPDSA